MDVQTAIEEGRVILALRGDAADMDDEAWQSLRGRIPWDRATNVAFDMTEFTGATDRAVETLLGLTADAHNHGGMFVAVGLNDDLRARMGSMRVERYIPEAMTIEEARARFDTLRGAE